VISDKGVKTKTKSDQSTKKRWDSDEKNGYVQWRKQFLTAQVSFDTRQIRSEVWVVCLIFWITQKLGNIWSTAAIDIEVTVFDLTNAEQWSIPRVEPIFIIPNKLPSVILPQDRCSDVVAAFGVHLLLPGLQNPRVLKTIFRALFSLGWNKVGDHLKRLLRKVLCARSIRVERAFEHDVVSCGHQLH